METTVALLLSDLSGYTALTETHGAMAAADLIEKYHGLVQDCLAGDSRMHEQVGDEVMIVSESPADLLATARMLQQRISCEESFLQVHGGLHYGSALSRNNRYFGSAVNLTSRIVGAAPPGAFWCSDAFVQALPGGSAPDLQPIGPFQFKNVAEPVLLHQLRPAPGTLYYIDPVCRMVILNTAAAFAHPSTAGLYFCSPACREQYLHEEKSRPVLKA